MLNVENYDYNTFVKELQQSGEYMLYKAALYNMFNRMT
jgi:hypothetical protein